MSTTRLVSAALVLFGGAAAAQDLNFVRNNLPPIPTDGFTWGVSRPTTISVVARGAGGAPPARYADFTVWSPWLTAATRILEEAPLTLADITSLTFFEPLQRQALLRAVAYNIIDNRMNQNFTYKESGFGKLNARVLFGQLNQDAPGVASHGFSGYAIDMARPLASEFLTQFQNAYIRVYGLAAWNARPAAWAAALNNVVKFGLVYAYWGSVPFGQAPTGNWNHSKIVSNGQKALVGGTNMYTSYLTPPDATGVVQDADLLLTGQPAVNASRWVDTLFYDYRWAITGHALLGVITFASVGPLDNRRCTCAVNGGIHCVITQRAGVILPWGNPSTGCFWGGDEGGRLSVPFTVIGGQMPDIADGAGPTVISAGQRGGNSPGGHGFINEHGLTAAQVAAYDSAIGNLIWSADNNPHTEIMVSQQDIVNRNSALGGTDNLGPEGWTCNPIDGAADCSWQRYRLTERIGYEMTKPLPDEHLRVFLIKSNQQPAGGNACAQGADYNTLALYKVVDTIWKDSIQWYHYMWDHPADFGFTHGAITWDDWRRRTATTIERKFCSIFRAAKFVYNVPPLSWTRLHNKMVIVNSPNRSVAGASIGSLNFYNALMMNDYGNIVFDTGATDTITDTLHQRFNVDWNAANYPNLACDWDRDHPRHCAWQCVAGTPCALQ